MSGISNIDLGDKHISLNKPLNPRFQCGLCKKLLNDPIQTPRGELACKTCYFEHLKKKPGVCPIDGDPVNHSDIFPDRSVSREINKLEVYCENETRGCTWIGSIIDIDKHEKVCEYGITKCNFCGETILVKNLDNHITKNCKERNEKCEYCKEEMKLPELKEHIKFCPKRPISCPFGCGKEVLIDALYNHFDSCISIRNGKSCPFAIFGCDWKKNGKDKLSAHLRDHSERHAALVIHEFVKLKGEFDVFKNQDQHKKDLLRYESVIIKLEAELANSRKDLFKLQVEIEKFQNISLMKKSIKEKLIETESCITDFRDKQQLVHDLTEIQFSLKDELDGSNVKSKLTNVNEFKAVKSDIDKHTKTIENIENGQALASSNLADLELKFQLLENTTHFGRQMWRVDNFYFRKKHAEEGKITALHSPPSYTDRYSYKFCARLYLNGDGSGKGTHLSLFFVVMRSQFDHLLKWPFAKKVTFKLIHPDDPSKSIKESFYTDTKSSSFQKPTKPMNVAAGCPMFVRKDLLETAGFVIDDSLFVETIVEDVI